MVDSINHLTNTEVDELLTTITMGTVSVDHMRQIQQTTRHINSIITGDRYHMMSHDLIIIVIVTVSGHR